MLANHKDAQIAATHPFEQIGASGFHCNIDDPVVVAPFLPGIQINEPVVLSSARIHFSEPIHSILLTYLAQTDGRGPPPAFCS